MCQCGSLQLYFWVFFSHIPYSYAAALELLQLHTVQWQDITVMLLLLLSCCSYTLYSDKASLWCSFYYWAAAVTHCTVTRHHFDSPFIIHAFPVYKFCPSMIDNSSLHVPSCNIRNFTQFSAGHKNRPSSRCFQFGMQWYRYRYIE